MRWLVTYRAILHQWSRKGKGPALAHVTEVIDHTAVVSVDLAKWIEGRRPNLHEFRTNPHENKSALELLEIISLLPLDCEASAARGSLNGAFALATEMPGLRLEH